MSVGVAVVFVLLAGVPRDSAAATASAAAIAKKIPEVGASGQRKLAAGDDRGAAADFQQAYEWSRQLAAEYPQERAYAENSYYYLLRLGTAFAATGDFASALKAQQPGAEGYVELAGRDNAAATKATAATALGQLAWYQIRVGNPDGARQTAERAVALDSDQRWIQANLAHALLLSGKIDQAKAIFRRERNTLLPNGPSFKELVLADIDQLEGAGVRNPHLAEIRALYTGRPDAAGKRKNAFMTMALIFGGSFGLVGGIIWLFVHIENKRVAKIASITRTLGFSFRRAGTPEDKALLADAHVMSHGRGHIVRNLIEPTQIEDLRMTLLDLLYTTGGGKNSSTWNQTITRMQSPLLALPRFVLQPESMFTKMAKVFGFDDINFPDRPEFSRTFQLRGENEAAVRQLFNPEIIDYCEQHRGICIEGVGDRLLVYRFNYRPKPEQIETVIGEGKTIVALFVAAGAGNVLAPT